jgi:hypothetical protein
LVGLIPSLLAFSPSVEVFLLPFFGIWAAATAAKKINMVL